MRIATSDVPTAQDLNHTGTFGRWWPGLSDAPLSSGECEWLVSGGFVAPHSADDAVGEFADVVCARQRRERPAAVEDRSEAGHWEGDLIIGAANRSAAATLVERVSRHALVVALPHGYTAPDVAAAVTDALARQPAHLVCSLTWDQGRETARWADIETALGIEVFFCEPHSPTQRGTNEQTNGLLRRWLPKGTPLDLSPLRLAVIEDNLNWMPRRLHNWQSAADIHTQLTRNHQ